MTGRGQITIGFPTSGWGIDMRYLLIVALLLFPRLSMSAGTVAGVSGSMTDGSTVQIVGTGFGATGPHVVLFDDFESGTAGEVINTGTGSAKYGIWTRRYASPYYGTAAKLSGSKSYTASFASSYSNAVQTLLPDGTTSVFASWWMYVPAGNNFPGEGTTDGDNWKVVWLLGYDSVHNDYYWPVRNVSQWVLSGNDPVSMLYATKSYLHINMVKGQWKRVWGWIKGSDNIAMDGEIKFWELQDAGVYRHLNKTGLYTLAAGGQFERWHLNGYGRVTPNCVVSFDDAYVATGPNAQARVEIGNANTYAASTKLTILTPTAWSNSGITAQVNKGPFESGPAYLYVFDAAGNPSSGWPVSWGAVVADTTPPTVVTNALVPADGAVGVVKNSPVMIPFSEPMNCSAISSVTISPGSKTVSCQDSVITITTSGQADSTTYTVTVPTSVEDVAGNNLASQYQFSYTTAVPAAGCDTNPDLCGTSTTCATYWPAYKWCPDELPACKLTDCAAACSSTNIFLCNSPETCGVNGGFWWPATNGACRTVAEPTYLTGDNLLVNPNPTTNLTGWTVTGSAALDPLGVMISENGALTHIRCKRHR